MARYFYDCRGDEVYAKSQLQSDCQQANVSSNEHTQFYPISNKFINDVLEIPLHVAAAHDAHILLASDNSFDSIRNGYEFGS